jgi:fatty acid desaturase
MAELGSLRAELRLAGVFEFRERRHVVVLCARLAALIGCFAGIVAFGWVGALVLIPLAGVLSTSIAMTGHEGSHRSFSASPARNAMLTYFAFPLFSGLSSLYWHYKHDRAHHGHPNVEGVDPDIRPWPFVSSKADHERSTPGLRWFQRNFQGWAFWPMALLMALGMRRSSLLFIARYRDKRDRKWRTEVACLAVHYSLWMIVPTIIWGPLAGIGVYTATWAIAGVCLALVFAPAHMGLPIVVEQNRDWIHQLETTRNLELPRPIGFFFMGLDYQVEHHLFPKIPHANLPRAAEITRAWCAQHGIIYMSMPYLAALENASQFIHTAWQRDAVAPDLVRLAG